MGVVYTGTGIVIVIAGLITAIIDIVILPMISGSTRAGGGGGGGGQLLIAACMDTSLRPHLEA